MTTSSTRGGNGDVQRLQRRAVRLAWATVGCNITEAIVAITAGGAAGSIALIGFGLDSIVEVLSALVILWQFRDLDEKREHRAIRLIAMSFWALAAIGIAILAANEGRQAWHGDNCCD
jgi:Co/Zn/Cd efflux system component